MENKMQLFNSYEFGSLEIMMIGEKPYFPATECAKILGYTNPQKAIRDHCKGVNESFAPSNGGIQKKNYIPEGDLYRLIVRSKLPSAVRFEKFVFDEILPAIRKSGAYITEGALMNMLQNSPLLAAPRPQLSEYNSAARLIVSTLKDANVPPDRIAMILKRLYEPLGISVPLDGMSDKRTYPASEIPKIFGMNSLKGKPHYLAMSALITMLDIGSEHKIVIPYQHGNKLNVSIYYDEYVVNAVKEWLEQNNWPCEMVFGKKTYKVAYKNREPELEVIE